MRNGACERVKAEAEAPVSPTCWALELGCLEGSCWKNLRECLVPSLRIKIHRRACTDPGSRSEGGRVRGGGIQQGPEGLFGDSGVAWETSAPCDTASRFCGITLLGAECLLLPPSPAFGGSQTPALASCSCPSARVLRLAQHGLSSWHFVGSVQPGILGSGSPEASQTSSVQSCGYNHRYVRNEST